MGVQKSKVSRSRRDKRRTHDKIKLPTLSIDKTTGETHLRHHMTADGYYRGRQIITRAPSLEEEEEIIPQSLSSESHEEHHVHGPSCQHDHHHPDHHGHGAGRGSLGTGQKGDDDSSHSS